MLKLSHQVLVIISGLIWFAIGFYLLQLGLGLLLATLQTNGHYPLISVLKNYFGGPEGSILLIVSVSLAIGYFKGRHVLGKSAHRGVQRILTFPNPTSIGNIYSPKYYILLGCMVALGMSVKYFGFSHDIRGFVDVTIGAALINGAVIYFRLAQALKTKSAT